VTLNNSCETDEYFGSGLIVLVEYVSVLSRLYGYSRNQIAFSVGQLLNADSFQVEDPPLVLTALT